MTPAFTKLERAALKLLIKFAWGNICGGDYQEARQLVIKSLELDDKRPVDTDRRRRDLNAFMRTEDPRS